MLVAEAVEVAIGFQAGDGTGFGVPLGVQARDVAVRALCPLEEDVGTLVELVHPEVGIEGDEGGWVFRDQDLHAFFPQVGNAAAAHPGIGVHGADDDPGYAVRPDEFRAGRGLAVMVAGFQGDVEGGLLEQGRVFHAADGIHLCVGASVVFMCALADDAARVDDHRPHVGIGLHCRAWDAG